MTSNAKLFQDYINGLKTNLKLGNATEHTHRPVLKILLESFGDNVTATNEPKRIECGAPDFVVTKTTQNQLTVGYVEAKDIGFDLEQIEKDSERAKPSNMNGIQLKRYRESLPNLLLTNYTDFRWYVDGEPRMRACIAKANNTGSLSPNKPEFSKCTQLLWEFLEKSPEKIASPVDLAQRMARLTHMIRNVIEESFRQCHVSHAVRDLYDASKSVLVPDLTEKSFSDMFAQTLAYGLFAARVYHVAGPFGRQSAAYQIPPTNPFLQQLFSIITGPALDEEPFVSFVDDLSQLLGNADVEAILSAFSKREALQDPILHFYEPFLAAYDPSLQEQLGVYYTPEPVVSYIVRSVDWLLRKRFDCVAGLANHEAASYELVDDIGNTTSKESHRVLVLDPACGTGTFLYAVIDHIREYYRSSGNAGMWNGYVKEHLLNRMFGFELLMAPYAMSHLKLGMQIAAQDMPAESRQDWSYKFDSDERLGVYLTNSLEQAEAQSMTLFGPLRVITEEASAAAEIKRDLPIMVVLGNPPYSGHSANASKKDGKLTWIGKLIEDYKKVDGEPLGEKNSKWLQDDYVKFIRFGQWRIEQSGAGILAFITNNAYLDNPTFRGMRQQLLDTFTHIYLLDLHGNANKKEKAPDGSPDQNVFDIRQGVSIALFVKEAGESSSAVVNHADLWGTRESKYKVLDTSEVSTTKWETIEPYSPNYMFRPWNRELEEEYQRWPKITDVMPVNSVGVVTARDKLTIHWPSTDVMEVVKDFARIPPETARDRYNLGKDSKDWSVHRAQVDLNRTGLNDEFVTPILYRPFDTRFTYYTGESRGFICRPRSEVMSHMLRGENLGLMFMRQVALQDDYTHFGVSRSMADNRAFYSNKGIKSFAPLYIYTSEEENMSDLYAPTKKQPNLATEFTRELGRFIDLNFIGDGEGDLSETFGPEDAFHYIYAVFHSPTYRKRYDQFLRADFPRVPIISDSRQFPKLVGLGRQLTQLHLMESRLLSQTKIGFPVQGEDIVESGHPKYVPPGSSMPGHSAPLEEGRVYISKDNKSSGKPGQYFEGVSPEVWEFRVGGYKPMEKWLKDRKGRVLSFDELNHYRRMGHALAETGRLMTEIDAAIEEAGGFGEFG
ncbi:MAG: N-6 DNA methylase [Caldilineaceae bacterium]|nr:N-6 DNA methylase [Caldilineaceae bacterium]